MTKDSREIIGSVRIGDTVFAAGQEEEFAAAVSKDELKRLTDQGAISGFGVAAQAPEKTDKPKG